VLYAYITAATAKEADVMDVLDSHTPLSVSKSTEYFNSILYDGQQLDKQEYGHKLDDGLLQEAYLTYLYNLSVFIYTTIMSICYILFMIFY